MADLLSTGAAWLAEQLGTNAGQSVTYRRGTSTVAVSATRGRTTVEETDGDRIIAVRTDDFLVDPDKLVLDGVAVTPRAGDLIDAADGTFRVLPAGGEPCSRPSGSRIRVHAKRIAAP